MVCFLHSVNAPFYCLNRKGQGVMKGIIVGIATIGLLASFFLYCCVRVGAREDRWMEEMEWKDRQDAGRKSG